MGTIPNFGHGSTRVPHVIISAIEHSSVLETLKDLWRKDIIDLSIIPVDENGIVLVDEIKKVLRPETVLVSVMYVNNEIGTIQPVKEITKLVRWYKKQNDLKTYPLVHCDAIQATNYLDINVERLGVDLMSLSGSKIYGPKSSGFLYIRNKSLVSPVLHGGDQEFGFRAGTEDVAQIVGFTKALEITRDIAEKESARLLELQNYFFEELEKNLTNYQINGSREFRIPNNINISISGVSSERLVIELDAQGIAASSQSACRSDSDEESYVIAAIRHTPRLAPSTLSKREGMTSAVEGSIRFTMGRITTKKDVEKTVKTLVDIVNKIRAFDKTLT
jgi:cysteine desulfurase